MAWPIIAAAAGAAVLGAVAQAYEGEKARKASRKELERIEELFNKLKPPGYDLTIEDPPSLHAERAADPRFKKQLKDIEFNLSKFRPEELKIVGKYNPEIATFIKEEAPKLIEQTEGMKKGREAQMAALRRLTEIGERDFDPVLQEKLEKAKRSAQGEAQSRQKSIMQDFARRGISGSGLDLAAQIGGTASTSDALAQANLSAQSEAYKNRLNALMQGADLGSRISAEDTDLQSRNLSAINAFNQRMAAGRQDWENRRAGSLNDAQKFNLGIAQEIANENVGARNRAQMYNDERTKYLRMLEERERDYEDRLMDKEDRAKLQKYGMRQENRDYQNRMREKMYQDQLERARGMAGIGSQRREDIRNNAQDRIAAYGGISGAINTGLMKYGEDEDKKRRDQEYYDFMREMARMRQQNEP